VAAGDFAVSVRNDFRETATRFGSNMQRQVALAAARALNRTQTTVRQRASVQIREVYNIKASVAKAQISLGKRASPQRLFVEVAASGRRIPLIAFANENVSWETQHRRAGVPVKIFAKRPAKVYPHTFVARGSRGVHVYKRTGPGRWQIMPLVGQGVPKAFMQREVIEPLKALAASLFKQRFEHDVAWRAGRLGR